jgi:hypothetical protein
MTFGMAKTSGSGCRCEVYLRCGALTTSLGENDMAAKKAAKKPAKKAAKKSAKKAAKKKK